MDIPTHPDALLSIDQVARLLGVETRTIRRWRKDGVIPAPVSFGGQLRWRLATISEWIRQREIEDAVEARLKKKVSGQS